MKPSSRVLIAVAVVALVVGVVQMPFLLESDNGDIPAGVWAGLTLFVGWGFVAAGLVAWSGQPENNTGKLMVVTGFLWFVASLQGFEDPWVFSLASLLGATIFAVAVHLLLAFPSGRLASGRERLMVIATYVSTTILLLPASLFATPEDAGCTDCPENKLLIAEEPTVAGVSVVVVLLLGIYVLGFTTAPPGPRPIARPWG